MINELDHNSTFLEYRIVINQLLQGISRISNNDRAPTVADVVDDGLLWVFGKDIYLSNGGGSWERIFSSNIDTQLEILNTYSTDDAIELIKDKISINAFTGVNILNLVKRATGVEELSLSDVNSLITEINTLLDNATLTASNVRSLFLSSEPTSSTVQGLDDELDDLLLRINFNDTTVTENLRNSDGLVINDIGQLSDSLDDKLLSEDFNPQTIKSELLDAGIDISDVDGLQALIDIAEGSLTPDDFELVDLGNQQWPFFSANFNTEHLGYYIFPNGLIMQWGLTCINCSDQGIFGNGRRWGVFPIEFPNNVFNVFVQSNLEGSDSGEGRIFSAFNNYISSRVQIQIDNENENDQGDDEVSLEPEEEYQPYLAFGN